MYGFKLSTNPACTQVQAFEGCFFVCRENAEGAVAPSFGAHGWQVTSASALYAVFSRQMSHAVHLAQYLVWNRTYI